MILTIEGVPDATVRLLNERLVEIFETEDRATRFLRSAAGCLAVAAVRHGHCLQIKRLEGECVAACLRKVHKA